MKKTYWFLVLSLVLIFLSLACNLGAGRLRSAATPTSLPPKNVESLEESLRKAVDEAQTGAEVKLEITEQQMTSFVANEIQRQDETPIDNPRVLLRDGQIKFLATVERQNIALPAEVLMTVQPDGNGRPRFRVDAAKIGPLPVPGNVKSDLESSLDGAFADEIESLTPNTYIESIIIADGVMTITGRVR